MAGGIKVSIVPDVTPFVRGMESAEKALEDTADALDDLARDAQRAAKDAGTGLAKGVERGTDDASSSVDDLEKSFRDLARAGAKHTKALGDDLGDDVKRGTHDAGKGLDEFKSEAASTARESAASFTGSADDIGDAFQETAANALAGFGPLGAAAGLALAAGFGTFLSRTREDAEKAKQAISDMYDDMLESGAEFLSKEFIADQLAKIYQGADDAAVKVKELRDLATTANIPEPLLARALVGDEQARQAVGAAIAEQRLKINEALDDATAKGQNMAPALSPAIEALHDIEDRVNGTSGAFDEARRNADAARDAIAGVTAPVQGVAASAEDARSKFDGIGRAIDELPREIPLSINTSDLDRQVREWRPPRVIVTGELEVRAGQRVV